jgi:glycosyltransferase involved in cell wall biosynthesis
MAEERVLKLSVVITTRNEEANIANCISSFAGFRDEVEVVVVDNFSSDSTRQIAESLGAKVFDKGPERCAQRNFGWRSSCGEWVLVLDADMIMPAATVREILSVQGVDACWIPEVRTGEGLRVKARNFERSFYDGTCIDALRLFRREVLERCGGYDENLKAGGEDWELDIRVLSAGACCRVLKNNLIHNEKRLTFRRMLQKKAYYTKGFAAYQEKWKGHEAVRRQFSPWYRFAGVFIENGKWRKLIRHPVLAAVMFAERFAVGLVYLLNRSR